MNASPVAWLILAIGTLCAACADTSAAPPVNDDFANALLIVGDPADVFISTTGSTIEATHETDEPNHANAVGGASIWYQWTATNSATITVDLDGSAFDTLLAIYAGDTIEALDLVVFNDDGDHDAGAGSPSKVVFNATAGTTYRIAIDGFPIEGIAPTGDVELTISLATPPPNDSFATPIPLENSMPIIRTGDSQRDSTIETGEPLHGDSLNFGTTWYTWIAPRDAAIKISVTNGSSRPSFAAVYVGETLGALEELAIDRYGAGARLAITAGTTYRIAVVGSYSSGAQTRGDITLSLENSDARPVAGFDFHESWRWLHPLDATDPAVADTDFNSTWHHPAGATGYDGPAFNSPAPAPLGYGLLAASPIATDIQQPDGARYGAYFLRSFELARPITQAVAEVLADDGAVIYIDGVEAGRINVTGDDSYLLLADDSSGTEVRTSRIAIGALAAGAHTVGVSLHNATVGSSDLGFDMRLLEGIAFQGNVALANRPLCTGFEDPDVGSDNYLGRSNGDELGWITNTGVTIEAPDGERAFEISNLTGVRLESERIDVSGKSNLIASFDLRAEDTSTGLEPTDFLHLYLEGSYDGLTFSQIADVLPRLTGGEPDPFEQYRSDTEYSTITTAPGDIPDGLTSIRFVVEATADSPSEHLIIDNLCLATVARKIRILEVAATSATGVAIRFEAEPGHLYELQASADLGRSSAWNPVVNEIATSNIHVLNAAGPLSTSEMYFRVIDFGED